MAEKYCAVEDYDKVSIDLELGIESMDGYTSANRQFAKVK